MKICAKIQFPCFKYFQLAGIIKFSPNKMHPSNLNINGHFTKAFIRNIFNAFRLWES